VAQTLQRKIPEILGWIPLGWGVDQLRQRARVSDSKVRLKGAVGVAFMI